MLFRFIPVNKMHTSSYLRCILYTIQKHLSSSFTKFVYLPVSNSFILSKIIFFTSFNVNSFTPMTFPFSSVSGSFLLISRKRYCNVCNFISLYICSINFTGNLITSSVSFIIITLQCPILFPHW